MRLTYFYKVNALSITFYCGLFIPLALVDARISTTPNGAMWNWWVSMNLIILAASSLFALFLLWRKVPMASIITRSILVPTILISFCTFDFVSGWFQYIFFHTSNPSTWGAWTWINWDIPWILPIQTVGAISRGAALTHPIIPNYGEVRITAILGLMLAAIVSVVDYWRLKK